MKRLIPAVLLLCLYACKKTVNIKLSSVTPQIVIQGEITDAAGPYTVTINKTVDFYTENNFPAIHGASVKIADNEGNVDSFQETGNGVYTTQSIQGKPGNTYTLTVLAQDSLYTGVSTMPTAVRFDSISFSKTTGLGGKTTTFAIVNYQDPPGKGNYYQFLEYRNNEFLNKTVFVFSDRLTDGRYISRTLRNDSSYLQPYDWLEIKMYCIDKPVYDYFNEVDQSSGTGGFNTSASPTNPISNIKGGALGYFSAHTIRTVTTQVF